MVNIGNFDAVQLTDFNQAIEEAAGVKAECNLVSMQAGDVPTTWADVGLLKPLTGYTPKTGVREDVAKFVAWYREYIRFEGNSLDRSRKKRPMVASAAPRTGGRTA